MRSPNRRHRCRMVGHFREATDAEAGTAELGGAGSPPRDAGAGRARTTPGLHGRTCGHLSIATEPFACAPSRGHRCRMVGATFVRSPSWGYRAGDMVAGRLHGSRCTVAVAGRDFRLPVCAGGAIGLGGMYRCGAMVHRCRLYGQVATDAGTGVPYAVHCALGGGGVPCIMRGALCGWGAGHAPCAVRGAVRGGGMTCVLCCEVDGRCAGVQVPYGVERLACVLYGGGVPVLCAVLSAERGVLAERGRPLWSAPYVSVMWCIRYGRCGVCGVYLLCSYDSFAC